MLTAWAAPPTGMAPVMTVEPEPRKLSVWLLVLLLVKPPLKFRVAPPESVLAMVLSLVPTSMIVALLNVRDLSPVNMPVALLAIVTAVAVLKAAP